MRTNLALWVALALAGTGTAAAQEHPLMQPNRDVVIDYRVTGTHEGAQHVQAVRMYFTGNGARFRVESDGQPGYAIMNRDTNRTIVVMPDQRIYMEMAFDSKQMMDFDSKEGNFTRRGTDMVAGLRCTVYYGKTPRRSGEVCLTDDGVLLRAKSDTDNEGGSLQATKVTYGAQPANLFSPPPDFQKMDMAHMPMGPGGPPGRPPR